MSALPTSVECLDDFVQAGVLGAAEIHVTAALLANNPGEQPDPPVVLAAALAVRAPQWGHVCVDLTTVADTLVVEGGDLDLLGELKWPEVSCWRSAVAASSLVRNPDDDDPTVPLVLSGDLLYLDRYWHFERLVAADLLRRAEGSGDGPGPATAAVLDSLFGPGDELQRQAAEAVLRRRLVVVGGGPGTGKTRTMARTLAAVFADGLERESPPEIALAAPTGKAASRLSESIAREFEAIDSPVGHAEASTIHRLLGRAGRRRFLHDRDNPLPHDVVIVDEVSMVSLPLMSRLLAAVRPDATLVLVGDPYQLASVEAGSVLSDILASSLDEAVVILEKVHRFTEDSGIARLATAVRDGDAGAALELLDDDTVEDATWVDPDEIELRDIIEAELAENAAEVMTATRTGSVPDALELVRQVGVLCATRRGPDGVGHWNDRIEYLAARRAGVDLGVRWYPGRAILVTRNDYLNNVFNGDIGVTVTVDGATRVAIVSGDGARLLDPARLDQVDTMWATTIHKSQGSEFDHAVVVMPPPPSPILSRELLYTGVTRARQKVTIVASKAAITAAIKRPITRASGLFTQSS